MSNQSVIIDGVRSPIGMKNGQSKRQFNKSVKENKKTS